MFSDNNRFGRFLVLGWRGRAVLKHRVDHTALKSLNKPSSLTAFIISKDHVVVQKPCGKQLVNFLYWDGVDMRYMRNNHKYTKSPS